MDIRSKVAGVTHENADGTDRQEILYHEVTGYSDIYLKPEPDNPHDQNAVAVLLRRDAGDVQLGFLKSNLARQVSSKMANGTHIYVTDFEVTGGEEGQNLGLNIRIGTEGSTKKERLESADKTGNIAGLVIGGIVLAGLALAVYLVVSVWSFISGIF